MKTIFDAINELKGDLNNTYLLDINNDVYLFHCIIDGDYVCSPFETDDTHEYICTQKEFNALVEDMSLGLDVNSVTHGELCNYIHADKTLLKKESIINKPLVYTKEFKVRGGSNCYAAYQPCRVVYSGTKYTVVVNSDGREFSRKTATLDIRDIDTRTDKEKAIDDIRSKCGFNKLNSMEFELLSKAHDKWVGK